MFPLPKPRSIARKMHPSRANRPPRRFPVRRWYQPTLQTLEDRTLLSFGTLPAYDPSHLVQTLFATDLTSLTITAGNAGTVSRFLQFTLNGSLGTVTTQIDLAPADPNSSQDGALALYDSSGNRLAIADSDPVAGHPGFESLSAALVSGKVYTLGVFFQAAVAADRFTVTVTPGPQVVRPAIALDLGTGRSPTTADTFLTPGSVNYYPLNLLDAGPAGTVTVTPTGLGANVFATLFRRTTATDPWQPIDVHSGTTRFDLTITPPGFQNLTDAEYLLALAPNGFSTASRSYSIDVQAPLLAPREVSPAQATDLLLPPAAPGTARVSVNSVLGAFGQQLYRFRAPSDGTVTVTVASGGQFAPVVSVYDAAGTRLLAVATKARPPAALLLLPVHAGASYLVRASASSGQADAPFTLTVQAPYSPANLMLNPLTGNASVTTVPNVTVGLSQGARYYRFNPAPGTNILVIGVTPGNGAHPIAADVVLAGANLPQPFPQQQVGAGQTLYLPVDISKAGGPLDLFVAATQGSDPATLQIGQLQLPTQLSLAQLTSADLTIQTSNAKGQLQVSPNAGAFGNLTGVQYYQLETATGMTNLVVTGSGGAQPLLAHYQEEGGNLRLVDYQLPSGASSTLNETLPGNQLEGVAAFALGFGGTGTNQLSVTTPPIVGSGVAMVPDLSHSPPTESVLNIFHVAVAHDYHQEAWKTILPTNTHGPGVPQVTFKPDASAAPLTADVWAYQVNSNGSLRMLGHGRNTAGNPIAVPLDKLDNLAGGTVLFQVTPVLGQPLGTGLYSLTMTVPTDDPLPFEVQEVDWKFYGTNPMIPQMDNQACIYSMKDPSFPCVATLPNSQPIIDVLQNQYGHGEAMGNFTSSQPYNTDLTQPSGALNVFRFWAINPGPVVVKTVPLPGSNVNPHLQIYKAHFHVTAPSIPSVEYLRHIDEVGPASLDWFPADRSVILSQSYINDFDLVKYGGLDITPNYYEGFPPYGTGGDFYYVVVKNQEGAQGSYRLVVDTAPMPLVGNSSKPVLYYQDATQGQVAYIAPATGGSVRLNTYLGNSPGQLGYFPIQVPAYHDATLQVTSLVNGNTCSTSGRWDLDMFDVNGTLLPEHTSDDTCGSRYTSGTFTIPAGSQMVFLRARSKESAPVDSHAQLVVTCMVHSQGSPPPATFSGTAGLLPTNPQGDASLTSGLGGGDGRLHDSVTTNQVKAYAFQAGNGPLTVQVTPDSPSTLQVRWGVYVNGALLAWNQTNLDPATTSATLLLPGLRQPSANPDIDYDPSPYQNVVVYVQGVVAPAAGGSFTVAVQTAQPVIQRNLASGVPVDDQGRLFAAPLQSTAVLPMRNQDLLMDPRNPTQFLRPSNSDTVPTMRVKGLQWSRLVVPVGFSGPLQLTVGLDGFNQGSNTVVHYDLYSNTYDAAGRFTGQLIASGNPVANFSTAVTFNLPASVVGGTSYYLRVGDPYDATAPANVVANLIHTGNSKLDSGLNQPLDYQDFNSHPWTRPASSPDGSFVDLPTKCVFIACGPFPVDPNHPEVLNNAAFWVGKKGTATFNVTIRTGAPNPDVNPYIALYQVKVSAGGFLMSSVLVDFVNDANTVDYLQYRLQADLDPGLYVLQVQQDPLKPQAIGLIKAQLPPYPVEEVVLNPNDGTNSAPLGNASTAIGSLAKHYGGTATFRTTFYHVIAPGGSQDGLRVDARWDNASGNYGSAAVSLWSGNIADGYKAATGGSFWPSSKDPVILNLANAGPNTEFLIGLERDDFSGTVKVTTTFTVAKSGLPNWVVDPIQLLPANGQTHVQVTVHNFGFSTADDTTAVLQYTPDGQPLQQSILTEVAIPAFGAVVHDWYFTPKGPQDTWTYITNYDPVLKKPILLETSVSDDSQSRRLADVDASPPTLTFALSDANMLGTGSDPNLTGTWGRYVTGITGVKTNITLQFNSSVSLVEADIALPPSSYSYPAVVGLSGTSASYTLPAFDFGLLSPTTATNPNILSVVARDVYGLETDRASGTKIIQVVPLPNWTGSGWGNDNPTPITFDAAKHQYNLTYHDAIVDKSVTLNQLLQPPSIPLIGDQNNRLLIEITATAPAGLSPNDPITTTLNGHAFLEILGFTVFDKTYEVTKAQQITDHLKFIPNVLMDSTSLNVTMFAVTFLLTDLNLVNFQTPEFPIAVLGIPNKVLAIQGAVQFGLDVTLNAGLTLGLDVTTSPPTFGLLPPTFIAPSIKISGTLAGEIQVVGFDLAKLAGTVSVTVVPVFGLPNTTPTNQVVPFSKFLDLTYPYHACFGTSGSMNFSLEADLLGFTIWSWTSDSFPLDSAGCTVQMQDNPPPIPPPVIHGGGDPVGHLTIEPSPNLVIDPSGNALYLQVVNGASGSNVIGNLAVSQRTNNTWSPLTTLPQMNSVSQPALAYSHDGSGTPAVVVYSALSTPGDPFMLTENQYLADQGIRWRYYNGTSWGGEQTLLADGRYNFNPALSFNGSGQGVVAWVHDTNATPVSSGGIFDRTANQIEAAVWDPVNHTWRTPQALTVAGSFYNPAVYAADDGKLYVVWLQDTVTGNQALYSIYDGTSWSTPAVLPILGLTAGGFIGQVAIGSESAGRLDVLLSYSRALPDGSAAQYLYNRSSTAANFALPAPVEVVASHADFSHLRTLQAPGGGLIAYWQQSDGVTNEIFTSRIGPTTSTWSTPAPLTAGNPRLPNSNRPTGTNLQFAPSLAVDTDGRYGVVYEVVSPHGANQSPPRPDPAVGNPMSGSAGSSSARLLPELIFSQPMAFAYRNPASNGTAVTNGAPSGSTVMAQAAIANRGLAGDSVRLDYFDGLPDQGGTLLGSETIYLGPGQTYTINHPFVVGMGTHTYAIKATAAGGQEVFTATHVVSATLIGMIDVTVGQIRLSNPRPHGGQVVSVTANIINLSNLPVGMFTVALYQGDPNFPSNPAILLGTQTVNGLAANGQMTLTFSWTVPAAGGNFLLTVRADSGKVLQEVTHANNDGFAEVSVLSHVALVPTATPPVSATLLNYSGVANVRVTAQVSNLGQTDLTNVPVQVLWSLEGGAFQMVASTIIPTLTAGSSQALVFLVTGLAGHNLYRVVVDPNHTLPDNDRANNVAQTLLLVQGLPDLRVGSLNLMVSSDGKTDTLTAAIPNQGIAGANQVLVTAFAVGNIPLTPSNVVRNGKLVGQVVLGLVGPLATTPVMFPSFDSSNLTGRSFLCVVVDPLNQFLMGDHTQNLSCLGFAVAPPVTPVNLRATALSPTQILLSWTNLAADATGILIQCSRDGINFTTIAMVGPTVTTFTDTELTAGTYCYRVAAFNNVGQSPYSNIGCASVGLTATQLGFNLSTTTPLAGTAFTLTVTALTPGNQIATGYLGTVHFTSTDPQAILPADYTFTAADAGVHTFTLALTTAGGGSITFRDAASGITGSATVAVSPGEAVMLRAAGFPSPSTAGMAGAITVTARDAYGNVATAYTGTVHFTSSDGLALLPGSYNFTAADNGVHTFSLTLNTAGMQRVAVIDLNNPAILGFQDVQILLAPPTLITFVNFNDAGTLQANGSARFTPNQTSLGIFKGHQDVGTPGNPNPVGGASFANGTYTLTASGSDIWDNNDHLHYVYELLTGDGEFIARMASFDNPDYWSKAGLMIRSDLTTGAQNAFMLETGPNLIHNEPIFQWRTNEFGGTSDSGNHNGPIQAPPLWLRLVRSGNNFSGYWAKDLGGGQHGPWMQMGTTQTIAMPATVYVGLAETAHNNGQVATATFDNVSIIGNTSATLPGMAAELTDGWAAEAGSIFTRAKVPIGNFTTSFTLRTMPTLGAADGLTFTIQNDPRGSGALGDNGGALGYGKGDGSSNPPAIAKSVAIEFNLYSNGSHASTTKLLLNGQVDGNSLIDMSSSGIDLKNGHPLLVTLTYDGTNLTETVKDTVTNATFTHTYAVNIPGTVGGTSAYLGFTGGTGGEAAVVDVVNWTGQFVVAPQAAQLIVTAPAGSTAGTAFAVTVKASDIFGNTVANYTGTVHFTSSDPQAGLPADYTFTASDHGVHTFMVTLKSAGNQTVTVTDLVSPSFLKGSVILTVRPAAAGTLMVSGLASPIVAGMAGSVTVTAKDAYGNVATGYTGMIHFTSSDLRAMLPADYTFSAADNGIHTFSATLKTAGTQSLTATDKATGTITGTQSGIVVTAAAATSLMVSGFPSPVTAGDVQVFSVTALDPFGNTAPGYRGTIHFSSSDGRALFANDYTFTAADNGSHLFGAVFRTTGTQSLTATDTVDGTITGTQAGIVVNPAAAVSFVVSTDQTTYTAGDTIMLTVTAYDAYGNVATGYSGTVTFSSSDPQAALPSDSTLTNGTGTFTAMLFTAGDQTITATDTVDSSLTGTATVTINPAAASSLLVDGFPSPTKRRKFHSFTVTAMDPYGNIATGYTGTIHFSSDDDTASLPDDYTFTADDQGVHVFRAAFNQLGTFSLTATDTDGPTITGTESDIEVIHHQRGGGARALPPGQGGTGAAALDRAAMGSEVRALGLRSTVAVSSATSGGDARVPSARQPAAALFAGPARANEQSLAVGDPVALPADAHVRALDRVLANWDGGLLMDDLARD